MNAINSLMISVARHDVTLLPSTAYEANFTASRDSIGFAFDAQSGSHAIGSDRAEAFSRIPNSMAVTPLGCDVRSRSERGGEYLLVSGPTIRVAAGRYRTNIQNMGAICAALQIRRWMLGKTQPNELAAEASILQLSEAVMRPSRPAKAARWMTSRRFRLIADAIDDNLAARLTVAGLAAEIGVSASFLSRAFIAYSGQTPYDYILSRRLQRARHLLATTDLPPTDIALCVGFSSQSHMTAIMKSRLGLNPSRISRVQSM
ncbi:Methylphosphotriester-DNA--protein-cysteine S-methyltransferase [Roseibium album]|nr:Methylphosphotriester-DNA--protein-cysteine S-methyltransferase [Roseibium album]